MTSSSSPSEASCERCEKPVAICVCDRIVPLETRHEVLVLQHPREPREPLSTVPLVRLSLPKAQVRVGLSWPSLEKALGRKPGSLDAFAVLDPRTPSPEERAALARSPLIAIDRKGNLLPKPPAFEGIIALDGTWSQAKALWWRNPWLTKLPRVKLAPREASIYGRLRKEPRKEHVSTLEAIADVLEALGEPPEVREALRRTLRTLVQRARDAGVR